MWFAVATLRHTGVPGVGRVEVKYPAHFWLLPGLVRKRMTCTSPPGREGVTCATPGLITLMGCASDVSHHSDEEVEHEQSSDDGEGSVGDAVHEGQIHVVVRRGIRW